MQIERGHYSFSHCLRRADQVADHIPVISTVVNIFDLFQKAAVIPLMNYAGVEKTRYYQHIEAKSWTRCLMAAVPILGNIYTKFCDDDLNAYRSLNLHEIRNSPGSYFWIDFNHPCTALADARSQTEFMLDALAPVIRGGKETLPFDLGHLPDEWRCNTQFLNEALETHPYLRESPHFWDGCLQFLPAMIKHPLFKVFIEKNPDYYKEFVLRSLEAGLKRESLRKFIKRFDNIPWAFGEGAPREKRVLSKVLMLKIFSQMTHAERDRALLLGVRSYPPLLSLFSNEIIEETLRRVGLKSEEALRLQIYLFTRGGNIVCGSFYRKVVEHQNDYTKSSLFKDKFDFVDYKLMLEVFVEAALFDPNLFDRLIPRIRESVHFLKTIFLKKPEIFRLSACKIYSILRLRVFDEVIAEKGKEGLTKLQKEIIILEWSKDPFSQFRSPRQVLGSTTIESLTRGKKNQIIEELVHKGPGLKRFSEEEIRGAIEGGWASSQEILQLNHYLTETYVIIWDVYLEFFPNTHDNPNFRAFLEKNPDYYKGYILRSLERGQRRAERGDLLRSFNHIPWVLEEGKPPEQREASRAIVLRAIAQMSKKEKDLALLNAAVCCPQFLDLFSNEDLEATLIRYSRYRWFAIDRWHYLQLHFYKRGGRIIDERFYRYVVEASGRGDDSLYKDRFRIVDEKLKEKILLEACSYDHTLFSALSVALRNNSDFLKKIFLRKPEVFLLNDFPIDDPVKYDVLEKIAVNRSSWVLTPLQIQIIVSHLSHDPLWLDSFTEQEILTVIPSVQIDYRRDNLKRYVVEKFKLRKIELVREARLKGFDSLIGSISDSNYFSFYVRNILLIIDFDTYKPYWRIKLPNERAILIDAETLSCDEVLRKVEVMKRFVARREALTDDRQIGHLALKRGIAELGVATETPPAPEGVSIDELQELYERYEFPEKVALRKSFLNYVEAVKKHEEDMPQMYKEALHVIKQLKESEDPDKVVTNLCYLAKDGELCAHGAHAENTLHVYRTLFNLMDIVAASEGVRPLVFSAALRALKRAAEKISAACVQSRHAYLFAMHCLRKEEYPLPDSFGGIDKDIYGDGREFWGDIAGFWSHFPSAYLKNLLVQVFNEANKKIKSDSKFIDLLSHELKGYVREQLIPLEVEKLAAEAMEKLAPLTEALKKIELEMGQMKPASSEAARAFLDKKLSILKRQKEALGAEIQAIRLARERDIDNLIVETIEGKKFLRYSSKGEATLTLEGAAALMEHYNILC